MRDAAARLADSGSETPRLDAELLLGHVLHVDRATLIANPDVTIGAVAAAEFERYAERRAKGEPVAYIRGMKEFYGLAFSVDPRALIPRPETETLVELALDRLGAMLTGAPREDDQPLRVWDIGTGTGAIAVALAVESRRLGYGADVTFRATDLSGDALALAVENAVVHGVADRIDFALEDLADAHANSPVDLALANLPYIPTATVPTLPVAASFEPVGALDGGPDGLDLVRRLIAALPVILVATGAALLEVGSDQAVAVGGAVRALGEGWSSTVHQDLAGLDRVMEITQVSA
jgi:release factor glutamine methyltransferase